MGIKASKGKTITEFSGIYGILKELTIWKLSLVIFSLPLLYSLYARRKSFQRKEMVIIL